VLQRARESAGWRAVGLAALLLVAALATLRAQEHDYVELLVELRIDRGPTANVLALEHGDTVLIATRAFLDLAKLGIDSVASGRKIAGTVQPAGTPWVIDTDVGYARSGQLDVAFDPGDAIWLDGELFTRTTVLDALFGVRCSPSVPELVVVVREANHLPVVQQLERERRRRSLAGAVSPDGIEPVTRSRRPVDGAVFDWSVSGATEDPLDATSVELGLGAQVLGGSGVVRHSERRFGGETDRLTTGSWTRVWHTTPWLRQVRLGEALGTGARPRIVRGGVVTNSPFIRPAAFDVSLLEGLLEPGWEVELYRGLQFLDYTRTDVTGRYAFDVPVLYGENPLRVIAYGPAGQVLRDRRTFEVAQERFPAGQFEYGIGGGACAYEPCDAAFNVDLRYGIDDRWTVRGGMDRFWRDSLPDLWHPYGSVAFQATRSLALFAEGVADAQVSGRIQFAPTQDFRATVGQTWFTGDVTLPLVGSQVEDSRTDASLFVRPPWLDYRTFGQVYAMRSRGETIDRDMMRAVGTARFDGARLDVGGTWERWRLRDAAAVRRTSIDVRYFQLYGGSLGWLRRTLFRGELRVDVDSGPTIVRGGIDRGIGTMLQLQLTGGWQRGVGMTLDFGFTASLRPVRVVSRNRVTPDGTRGVQSVEGSVLWESQTSRLEFADGRSLNRAGIVGEVFVDLDGDGSADPGEPRVSDVSVRIGPLAVRTDETGRFSVWDVVPFEPLVLSVDSGSVRDPLLVPATARLLVRPDPNTFTPIPVALVQTGEVSGVALIRDEGRPLAGIQVELRNLDTGQQYSATTFSDGSFYVLGVRPGRYEATVSEQAREMLSLSAQADAFEVAPSGEGAIVDGVLILADRR
jgi:hypothetical protein